jgi:hypothetical protein
VKTAALVFSLLSTQALYAAEFFCPSGDVACLIAAINEANGLDGEHLIKLEGGSYAVSTANYIGERPPGWSDQPIGLPSIRRHLTIKGLAAATIERVGPIHTNPFALFDVSPQGALIVDNLNLVNGETVTEGGAIYNAGTTFIVDCIVANNAGPGAVTNAGGTLDILRSIFTGNSHWPTGAIRNHSGGRASIRESTISHNASLGGGGISNGTGGHVVIQNSAITFNRSDGSSFAKGGGILNWEGTIEIYNSTIAGNADGPGGGIANQGGQIKIVNSTITTNKAAIEQSGGGIFNDPKFDGTVILQNTILAGNSLRGISGVGPDCFGTITSLGHNIIGDPTGCTITLQPTDLTGDPGLADLVVEEFGDPAYYPVLSNSRAIDAANPDACPETDQIGNPRVGICDIGAIENQDVLLEAPDITVIPTSLDAGEIRVRRRSPKQVVSVKNDGSANLIIGAVSIGGTDTNEFAKASDRCSNRTLPPGRSCKLTLRFIPTSVGAKTATLIIPSNDTDENPVNVSLSGSGER